ncbi:MAG: hypothetical protein ACK5QX_11690 [bacterium]
MESGPAPISQPETGSRQIPDKDPSHSGSLFRLPFQVNTGREGLQATQVASQCARHENLQTRENTWWRRRRPP